MYIFQQKMKYIKERIKKWNKDSFGNIMEEKEKLEKRIEEIKTQAIREGYTEDGKAEEQALINELMRREQQEEIIWKQKSRKLWLREGDRNTSFFHKSTVQHRQQNKIYRLKARDGTILEEQRPIEHELIRYYSEL